MNNKKKKERKLMFIVLLSFCIILILSSLIEQTFSSHILEPIEELSEEEKGNEGLDQGLPA
jgi:hypothetical protein